MRTIEVSDKVYTQFAAQSGTTSEECVASLLVEDEQDLSALVASESMAEQRRIADEMDREGGCLPSEELRSRFDAHGRKRLAARER